MCAGCDDTHLSEKAGQHSSGYCGPAYLKYIFVLFHVLWSKVTNLATVLYYSVQCTLILCFFYSNVLPLHFYSEKK